jgi:predicted permease
VTRRSLAARVLAAAARTFGGRLHTRFGDDPVDTMAALAADVRARQGRVAEIRYIVREIAGLIQERRRSRSPSPSGGMTMFEPLRHDLHWTLRLARRRPLGSLAVALTLAITIAAATTAYGLATAVLWRPLPFDAADRLVLAWEGSRQDDGAVGRVTSSRYADWRDHAGLVESLAAFGATGSTIDTPDGARAVSGVRVTANYFDTLGIDALVGRTFLPGEEQPGRTDVVVLSHAFWQEQFGGRPDTVGEALRLGGRPFTVIGVMPPVALPGWPRNPAEVTLDPAQATYWVPIPRTPEFDAQARSHVYGVLGRLAPGATREAAEAQLAALATPDSPDPHGAVLRPLRDQFVRDARRPLTVLLAAALAVLLIACANLAAVQVTVMQTRRDELAVRAAIGAGRRRLARQLLTESLVLALAGGAAGLVLAQAALAVAPGLLPSAVPLLTNPRLDLEVALFGGGVALVCGLFVAAWPVAGVAGAIPTPLRASLEPRRGVYRTLVVGQIAVTVPLVAAAALLAQSLWTVRGRDAGFAIDHVLVADLFKG